MAAALFFGAPVVLIILLCFCFALLGAVMGSFASAISYRVLEGESWIFAEGDRKSPARSRCPSCSHPLAWYDLIPIFSWGMTRGKCRYCQGPISARYPLVEMVGALLLLIVFLCGAGLFILVSFVVALPFALACGLVLIGAGWMGGGRSYPLYLWVGLILDAIILCYVLFGVL